MRLCQRLKAQLKRRVPRILFGVIIVSGLIISGLLFLPGLLPRPHLSLSFNPSKLIVSLGEKRNETLTINSVNGLSGNLAVTATVPARLNPNTVNVTAVQPALTIDSGKSVTTTIVVEGGYDGNCAVQCWYAQDTSIQVSVAAQGLTGTFSGSFQVVTNESAAIDKVAFLSPTYANLTLRNTGPDTITYQGYNVTNQAGSAYSFPLNLQTYGYEGTAAGALFSAKILIGSSCLICTLHGTPFTYTPGQIYIVTIETVRGNTLSFTIAA